MTLWPFSGSKSVRKQPQASGLSKLVVDCHDCITDLCRIGGRYQTDKSPLNEGYRHAYTPVYDFLFAPMRHRPLALAEIGILDAAGLRTFREYFPKARLYGFEYDQDLIEWAKQLELPDTSIAFIDVRSAEAIDRAFEGAGELFDIIIDDSTHAQEDQLRLIERCARFLQPGGVLVIEDIFDDERASEQRFESTLGGLRHEYRSVTFVLPKHPRTEVGSWNNEKLLVLVKQ